MTDKEAVIEAVEKPLEERGILLEDVRAVSAGSHRTLTVTIDLAGDTTEPVSVETIEAATAIISEHIDELPLFKDHPYTLEVTSPGADRPLTRPHHFARVVGRTLALRTADGKRKGELVSATAGHIVLRESSGDLVEIPYGDIEHAEVVLKFR